MKYEFATLISKVPSCCRKLTPFGFLFSSPKGPTMLLIESGNVLLVPTLQLMSCPNRSAVSLGVLPSRVWIVFPNSMCCLGSTGW